MKNLAKFGTPRNASAQGMTQVLINGQVNFIKNINDGLKTKFDTSNLKFKSTFAKGKKLGVDLANTTKFFKKEGVIYIVIVTGFKYKSDGRYRESVSILPYLNLRSK